MANSNSTGGSGNLPASYVVVQPETPAWRVWLRRFGWLLLVVSLILNGMLYYSWGEYYKQAASPSERYHSGDRVSLNKIAIIKVHGTIMPPFTERWIREIEKADKDDRVKGVLLDIDSPGGLVADSHQIYRKLRDLNAKKPIAVAMKRMAASGGYYIAMGSGVEGKIYAEPTTWTGSIGVIIPRFDASELANKVGVQPDPLKTGPFKDALSPFRPLTPEERAVWDAILDDAYTRFLSVITENRKSLNQEKTRALATGQIYTADQAKSNGLVDEIGYNDDAIQWLKEKSGIENARIVTYESPKGLIDMVLGATANPPRSDMEALLEASVPRAMYYCSWGLAIPTSTRGN